MPFLPLTLADERLDPNVMNRRGKTALFYASAKASGLYASPYASASSGNSREVRASVTALLLADDRVTRTRPRMPLDARHAYDAALRLRGELDDDGEDSNSVRSEDLNEMFGISPFKF